LGEAPDPSSSAKAYGSLNQGEIRRNASLRAALPVTRKRVDLGDGPCGRRAKPEAGGSPFVRLGICSHVRQAACANRVLSPESAGMEHEGTYSSSVGVRPVPLPDKLNVHQDDDGLANGSSRHRPEKQART
jgi:hypothetical protein